MNTQQVANIETLSPFNTPKSTVVQSPTEKLQEPFARGAKLEVIISHIRNTAPFIFDDVLAAGENVEYLRWIREASDPAKAFQLTHDEYFRFALSAHWATVGTFVPTDVDNQIRFKLWHPTLPVEVTAAMAETVLRAYDWDHKVFCQRFVTSPLTGEVLAGHHGEWFSVAVAAYAATKKRLPELSQKIREKIEFEVTRHAKVYLEFKRARDGVGLLKTATLIAHNLGDLDRVLEMWKLSAGDALYDFAFKAGHDEPGKVARFSGALGEAGRLNKAFMAPENHRHLPLREPRCLRRTTDFLLPVAPFFDEWGTRLAKHPVLDIKEIAEVVEALYNGWERVKGPDGLTVTYAYPRAVAGILESVPGGMGALSKVLPAKIERNLKTGLFRSLVSVSRQRFEEQWNQMALNFVFKK